MSPARSAAWILATVLTVFVSMMTVAGIILSAPGFLALLPLFVLWWGRPARTFDDEIAELLKG